MLNASTQYYDLQLGCLVTKLLQRMDNCKDPRLMRVAHELRNGIIDGHIDHARDPIKAKEMGYKAVLRFVEQPGYYDLYGFIQRREL